MFPVVSRIMYLCSQKGVASYAIVAQLVEHELPKLRVAGSSPVYRSCRNPALSHFLL